MTRQKQWDLLWHQLSRTGLPSIPVQATLGVQHKNFVDALNLLTNAKLTITEIEALGAALRAAYNIGGGED